MGKKMSDVVIKYSKVIFATYDKKNVSIVLHVEAEDCRFFTEVPLSSLLPNVTNLDSFTEEQLKTCGETFCENINGKMINVVFDDVVNKQLAEKYNGEE